MQGDTEASQSVGTQDLGVRAVHRIVRLRSGVEARTELSGVKVFGVEPMVYRQQDLVEELLHHRRVGPRRFVVAPCIELVDKSDGGNGRATNGRLLSRKQHVDAIAEHIALVHLSECRYRNIQDS